MNIQIINTSRKSMNLLKPPSFGGMRGFSLLEMAMVLAIIGLVMGTILAMTKTLTTSSRIAATQSKEALIKAALTNFIATNNRLPCPADVTGALSTPAGTLGIEAINTAIITPKQCNQTPSTGLNPVYAGVVPWVTLGLTQDGATDGYNQYFTYLVAVTAIQTVPVASVVNLLPSISGLKGAISIYSDGAAIHQINNCMPATYVAPVANYYNQCSAVAVIISHGADGLGAYTSSGPAAAFPNAADELLNASHTNKIVMHDASLIANNPFDDIILPITSSDFLTPLAANGTIQPYNAVLNTDFANIISAITNYALTHRTPASCVSGCTFNFPSTAIMTPLSTAAISMPSSIINDPWGNQIVYNLSISSIAASSVPSATVFTLQSNGPDGVQNGLPSAGGDDIQVSIPVNQFLAPFQNYW